MNTKQIKYKKSAMVFLITPLLLSVSLGFSKEKPVIATTEITLTGKAKGGVLTLVDITNRNSRCASISTQPGESSESVATRLAAIINDSNPFEWGGGHFEVIAKDSSFTLLGHPGTYAFTGTEMGLGIPEPPISLSGKYNVDNNQVILNWQNPPSGFDNIFIVKCGLPGTRFRRIAGSEEKYVYELGNWEIRPIYYFCVIGTRDGVPSSPAAIHLTNSAQEELLGIPFTDGVAPNWTTWVMGGEKNAVRFEQGVREEFVTKKGRTSNPIQYPDTKPFYQVIKITTPGAIAGIKRKFLGLTPGHTYRISAGLNTLEMDSAKENWSFSLHAAYNAPDGADLGVEQLGGLAALPDGSKGAAVGRIALYERGLTTNGTWEERSTGKERRGMVAPDISLPPGIDTMTVWVRHRGADSTGVGIDWVKIEDLSVLTDKSQK